MRDGSGPIRHELFALYCADDSGRLQLFLGVLSTWCGLLLAFVLLSGFFRLHFTFNGCSTCELLVVDYWLEG